MFYSPLLPIHIAGGCTAIVSGAVAMSFRKGSGRHSLAGKVFAIAMLAMAGSGVVMAVMKNQATSVLGGMLALYLVSTAWATAKRGDGETGVFDRVALVAALVVGAFEVDFGFAAVNSPTGLKNGYPATIYFVFAAVFLLSAAGDIRMLRSGGLFGTKRIVRHLWRMCFAFFVATASFFLGQQKVFPVAWRGSGVWFVPAFLPLALLVFWLLRVRLTGKFKGIRPETQGAD
jgi:uncharacterized membrane protein